MHLGRPSAPHLATLRGLFLIPDARVPNDSHPRGAETRLARRSDGAEPVVLEDEAACARDAATGRDALTAGELRVARLAADGLGNREIAQALFITAKTAKVHLSRVYQKLGITNRGQRGSTTWRPPAPCDPGTLKVTALPFDGLSDSARACRSGSCQRS